ncbi:GAP1-N1 domain-containing protein [Rubripirellula reticaptiva]|uniref:Uncharacterized protein n=1 Tax=Rubripirellula reticaptiva TaxID=2528013 RepID=A0A5C6F752_9BACT|nr:hypothetical protein [Rubripirellula reticaptiva]TWU55926.1 hypothetical protein Poly59_22290 [Rubripirellula reticaptiva]
MRISFDVAIFGEKGTEHGMLWSTSESVPKGLVVHTDLPIDLPESEGFEPMLAGFALDGNYVFLSTIRDTTAKRAGMARTVALFAPAESVTQLDDLGVVVSELGRLQVTSGKVSPVTLSTEVVDQETAEPDKPVAAIFGALAAEDVKLPVVWEGLLGFSSVLIGLWKMLPEVARPDFQFRIACRPSDGASQGYDLVCSPTERIARWNAHQIVRLSSENNETSVAVNPLVSHATRQQVYSFAKELGLNLGSLRSLPALMRCYLKYTDLPDKTDLQVTTLFRTVGRLSPKPTEGLAIKKKVCEELASRVKGGPAETLMFLRNLTVDAYPNGRKRISQACDARFYDLLVDADEAPTLFVQEAISASSLPWSQGVLRATKRAVENCIPGAAKLVAELFCQMKQPAVADWIENSVEMAPSFEDCLILHAAERVCENASTQLLNLCKQQNWIRLHVRVGSKLLSPAELMRQQAALKSDLTLGAAELSAQLGDKRFALEASKSDVVAYWVQVAIDCEHDGALMASFDYLSPCWRHVFCHFAEHSLPLPRSVDEMDQNIQLSWQAIAGGELTDSRYVHALSQSHFANVLEVPDRALVWARLESIDRETVLEATAEAWFQAAGDSSVKATVLEPVLRAEVLAERYRAELLPANEESDLRAAIQTFENFDELGEEDFAQFRVRYLSANLNLSEVNASKLGEFIQQRDWWRLAKALLNDYKNLGRIDLFPALQACRKQFGMFTRYIHGINEGPMPDDAWWAEAVDVLSVSYPSGPSHNSLWSRAGGELCEIPLEGSGKDRWAQTVAMLRRGRDPKQMHIGNLLWQVRQDGAADHDVNALIDHCPIELDLSCHEPFVD